MTEAVNMQNDVDDELNDIFGLDTKYEAPSQRKKKEFSPWHRPRKQFVREEQWCTEIEMLADNINFDGRPLRYIGLPGNELFDLRTIHELICKPRQLPLKFLGFNNAYGVENDDGFELNLSTVEVRELERVDGISKVMPDDFKSIGTPNSMAWNNAQKFGHFDIVNVDLCDGLFTAKPGVTSESYYSAIKELINLQQRCGRGEPWLLFLTTRVGENAVHPTTIKKLKLSIEKVLLDCVAYASAAQRYLNFSTMAEVEELIKTRKGFSEIFCTGILNWLIGLGLSAQPLWKVSLKSAWHYKVNPEADFPDLLSFAIEFAPIQRRTMDSLGLTPSDRNKDIKLPDMCSLASAAVPTIAKALDVDAHLQTNIYLYERYIERSAALYEKARYSGDEYRAWLAANNY